MNLSKRAELEAAGFRIGSVAEFLKLTPEEEALIEMKLESETRPHQDQSHARAQSRGEDKKR